MRFPGFHVLSTSGVVRSSRSWEALAGPAGTALERASQRLKRSGFVARDHESLAGHSRTAVEIASLVEQFQTSAGARAELADALAAAGGFMAAGGLNGLSS